MRVTSGEGNPPTELERREKDERGETEEKESCQLEVRKPIIYLPETKCVAPFALLLFVH